MQQALSALRSAFPDGNARSQSPAHNSSCSPRRRLIIMRHGESEETERGAGGAQDHDRALTQHGREAAKQVAQTLQRSGWLPDLVLSSSARRTTETLQSMVDSVKALGRAEVHTLGSLYAVAAVDGQTLPHLQAVVGRAVEGCQRAVGTVLCIGHNRGMEEAASELAGRELELPTASAALFECTASGAAAATWGVALRETGSWRLADLLAGAADRVAGPGAAPAPESAQAPALGLL